MSGRGNGRREGQWAKGVEHGVGTVNGPPIGTVVDAVVDAVDGMTVGAGAKPNGQNWMGFMTWVDRTSGTIDLSNYRSETHNGHGTPIRSQRDQGATKARSPQQGAGGGRAPRT